MIEKFSDYESVGFLNKEGDFDFEVKSAELTESKRGSLMVKLEVESRQAGKSTLYHTLDPKARWSYNNLIKACLHDKLDTPEKVEAFELDYTLRLKAIRKKLKFLSTTAHLIQPRKL